MTHRAFAGAALATLILTGAVTAQDVTRPGAEPPANRPPVQNQAPAQTQAPAPTQSPAQTQAPAGQNQAPAVQNPAPANQPPAARTESVPPAVDIQPNANPGAPLEGANSFTEEQARDRIERAGMSAVTGLTLDDKGVWRGKAVRGADPVDVSVDFRGNVVAR